MEQKLLFPFSILLMNKKITQRKWMIVGVIIDIFYQVKLNAEPFQACDIYNVILICWSPLSSSFSESESPYVMRAMWAGVSFVLNFHHIESTHVKFYIVSILKEIS